jgi:hypothetical protein
MQENTETASSSGGPIAARHGIRQCGGVDVPGSTLQERQIQRRTSNNQLLVSAWLRRSFTRKQIMRTSQTGKLTQPRNSANQSSDGRAGFCNRLVKPA